MTIQAEDILHTICSSVKETNSNGTQVIFALEPAKEAALAFEILVAYGFDAKIYHTPEKPSKLYLTRREIAPEIMQHALAYAKTLHQIKGNLDGLLPALPAQDFTVHFMHMPPAGKQILVQISPASGTAAPTAQPAVAAPVASVSRPVAAPAPARGKKPQAQEDILTAGPSVAKTNYAKTLGSDATRKDTVTKRLFFYLTGNITASSFAMFVMVAILGIIFSLFIFAKAFICPDFASMKKNHSWYCSLFVKEDDSQQ